MRTLWMHKIDYHFAYAMALTWYRIRNACTANGANGMSIMELRELLMPVMMDEAMTNMSLDLIRKLDEDEREQLKQMLGHEPTDDEVQYYRDRRQEKLELEESKRKMEARKKIDQFVFGSEHRSGNAG